MATHVKIKTEENNCTHVDTHSNNYTLCGLETGGDEGMGIQVAKVVETKITCQDCIRIIEFCRKIKRSEWK